MRMYLISDNVDTQVGMRLAGIEGEVVHEYDEVCKALERACAAEDIGIVLGQAFKSALSDKKGIVRYGSCILPMDEALIMSVVDISGRSFLKCSFNGLTEKVGDFDTELVEEFFTAFTRQAELTLHIRQIDGSNTHHILEGAFKSTARSLRQAVKIDEDFKDEIPSTKGVL